MTRRNAQAEQTDMLTRLARHTHDTLLRRTGLDVAVTLETSTVRITIPRKTTPEEYGQ